MFRLSAKEVESGTNGNLVAGPPETIFSGVSIDTRTLGEGAVFFAIRGPNHDGHRFIPNALSKGALGFVVAENYEFSGTLPPDRVLIKVADTHDSLKYLAMSVRLSWPGTLVAITGSMGKTTTREFSAQLLEGAISVYQTPGNYNNLFGLPLALFGLSLDYEIGVFEMGMSAPGEIAEMCRIAKPAVGIITNVAPVHMEFFESLEKIARAKGELAAALPPEGTLIYNADDPHVQTIAGRFPGNKISFGSSDKADIRAEKIEIVDLEKTQFQLSLEGITRTAVIPFAGAHYVMNVLPAVALGRLKKMAVEQILERIGTLRQAAMRGRILAFKDGFTLIDDSYNSNPRALMQMIEVLAVVPSFKRRILVAGEMLELGNHADSMHAECGSFASDRKVDFVIGVQGAARELVRAATGSGIPETQARFFGDADSAADYVSGIVQQGDLLLIKGSRSVHTERIVQSLRSRFEPLNN